MRARGARAAAAGLLAAAALCASPAVAVAIPTTGNTSGPRYGGWLGVALLVVVLAACALLVAWALRRESRSPRGEPIRLMREAREMVGRPENRFMRSGWDDDYVDLAARIDTALEAAAPAQ